MDYRRPSLIARVAEPLKGAAQRFALGALVAAAFGLMFLGKADTRFAESLQTTIADVAAPILETMAEPVAAIHGVIERVGTLAALHAENQRLREEVERLRAWHAVAMRLEAENAAFRDLVNYAGPERHSFITGRVIADGRGPFVKSVLVNVGGRDGVLKGHAAATQLGLVGRVSEAGERSSRVLMVTDLNSRIPVLIHESRVRAILAGDNSEQPLLAFLPESAGVKPGQRVVTSGHGGSLPAGIPVGVVSMVDGGTVRVRPFVDWERLEYVQIIDFAGTAPPAKAVPPAAAAEAAAMQRERNGP